MVRVYALINPINDQVFYIGCTKNMDKRLEAHYGNALEGGRRTYRNQVIDEIADKGMLIDYMILEKCSVGMSSYWEEFYIELFRSYGYHLPQMTKSGYRQTFYNNKNVDVGATAPISYQHLEVLENLSKERGMPISLMLGFAVNMYVANYREIKAISDKREKNLLR